MDFEALWCRDAMLHFVVHFQSPSLTVCRCGASAACFEVRLSRRFVCERRFRLVLLQRASLTVLVFCPSRAYEVRPVSDVHDVVIFAAPRLARNDLDLILRYTEQSN